MLVRPFPLLAGLALAACSSPEQVADRAGVDAAASADGATAKAAAVAAGGAKSIEEETDLYSFAFSYPAPVGAHPLLAARLEREADEAKAELMQEAREARADARANGYPFNPHSFSEEWKVVADVPGYLSLSGDFSTYSGGAHGMYGLESLVWDKRRKTGMDGADLFASPAALDRALGRKLCDALNAEREKRRGEPVPEPAGEDDLGFDSCQRVADATVLVGSSNGKAFDRIAIWFGPYVAGPYAEGAFELDFPVDAAVLAAVKPEFRAAFSAGR